MEYPEYEKLFLLEVFVDSLYISNSSLDLDQSTKANLKETCVMFQFLNYPPLVVCEEDFFTNDTQLTFKSGKSCIFSIRSSSVPTLPYKFEVTVSVIRKLEQPSSKVIIGKSIIDLGDSFAALMHSSVCEPELPLQKTKAGTFDISDEKCRKIGNICAFLRISSFGQLIVTQFQVGKNQGAFMFKGTEPKKLVELPGDKTKIPKIQVDPTYESAKRVEEKESEPRAYKGYGDTRELQMSRNRPEEYEVPAEYYEPPPPPQEPPGNYKEIVAEIRGHSLHIRVPMKSKKDKGDDIICKKQLMDEIEGPPCKYAPQLNLCDCDFPVPPEAIPRCGPL